MFREICKREAVAFLIDKHYSGRKPNISYSFGWFQDENLVAVCTFGKPASPQLCYGICGKEHSSKVFELNRLCRLDGVEGFISEFVSFCLRQLKDKIIVSYSDTAMI